MIETYFLKLLRMIIKILILVMRVLKEIELISLLMALRLLISKILWKITGTIQRKSGEFSMTPYLRVIINPQM